MRIVITESLGEQAFERLHARHHLIEARALQRDQRALVRAVADAEALVVRNRTHVDADLLAAAPHLRVVGRLGVGLNNIDLAACRARGIEVVVPRGANGTSVAEYVLAALLHFARPLADADADVRKGGWQREAYAGTELAGRRLGLLGLGETGLRVARRAQAFGMEVWAWAPHSAATSYAVAETGVRVCDLQRLLRRCHFVSLHVPLDAATHHLIGAAELAVMRRDAVLVNAARGGLVDEEALFEALASRHLAGAALDVRDPEPPLQPDRLARLDNVLLTPHLAGHTAQSLERIARYVVRGVLRYDGPKAPIPATAEQRAMELVSEP